MSIERYLPLTGIAGVLLCLASFAAAGDTPLDPNASHERIVTFYSGHETEQVVSSNLLGVGALFVLLFSIVAARHLDDTPANRAPAAAVLAGGVVVAVGLLMFAGLTLALGQVAAQADPAAVQALYVLNIELYFPVTVGSAAFLLGAAEGNRKSKSLPSWLTWLALVSVVLALIPSHILGGVLDHIGFGGFIGLGLWIVVASAVLFRRGEGA